ncbi:MAG: hypothetical protein WCO57_04895 [Verrucomicrobiota bacterium]
MSQFKTTDSFNSALAAEMARPQAFRDKLASIQSAAAAKLQGFADAPLDSDIAEVLQAKGEQLAVSATLETFDAIAIENRARVLGDAFAARHAADGKAALDAELAIRTKGRPAKMAALGKESASIQEAMFKPDLPEAELVELETRRAFLVGTADSLDSFLTGARNDIARFSNVPSAETWRDAVRSVGQVDFSV